MDVGVVIGLGAVYAFIYYFSARRVLFKLKIIDPDYFNFLGTQSGPSYRNSSAVIKMIFDNGIPKKYYPASVTRDLLIARVMLGASPVVLIAIFFAL